MILLWCLSPRLYVSTAGAFTITVSKMGGAQATAGQRTNIELRLRKRTMRTEAVQLRWIVARVMLTFRTRDRAHSWTMS